jgi:hypothetical protein
MAPEFDKEVGVPELVEGITALILGPILLPVMEGINQPSIKAVIKEGIAVSERCKEAIAATGERFEDLVAEVQAELAEEQAKPSTESVKRAYPTAGQSETAMGFMSAMSDLDERVRWLTDGAADLRLLVPLGFGAFALRQLLDKGLELDEIPWYTFAWYAFDSFIKLHNTDELQRQPDYQRSTSPEAWESPTGETP